MSAALPPLRAPHRVADSKTLSNPQMPPQPPRAIDGEPQLTAEQRQRAVDLIAARNRQRLGGDAAAEPEAAGDVMRTDNLPADPEARAAVLAQRLILAGRRRRGEAA